MFQTYPIININPYQIFNVYHMVYFLRIFSMKQVLNRWDQKNPYMCVFWIVLCIVDNKARLWSIMNVLGIYNIVLCMEYVCIKSTKADTRIILDVMKLCWVTWREAHCIEWQCCIITCRNANWSLIYTQPTVFRWAIGLLFVKMWIVLWCLLIIFWLLCVLFFLQKNLMYYMVPF